MKLVHNANRNLTCPLCVVYAASTKLDLIKHMERNQHIEDLQQLGLDPDDLFKLVRSGFDARKEYGYDVASADPAEGRQYHRCCFLSFMSRDALQNHVNREHLKGKVEVECDECAPPAKFYDNLNFKLHKLKHRKRRQQQEHQEQEQQHQHQQEQEQQQRPMPDSSEDEETYGKGTWWPEEGRETQDTLDEARGSRLKASPSENDDMVLLEDDTNHDKIKNNDASFVSLDDFPKGSGEASDDSFDDDDDDYVYTPRRKGPQKKEESKKVLKTKPGPETWTEARQNRLSSG